MMYDKGYAHLPKMEGEDQTRSQNVYQQFVKYVLVGGASFVIDIGSLYFFVRIFQWNYLLAAAVAFLVGLTINFLLAKQFVFKEKSKLVNSFGEFVSYGLIGLAGLGLTAGLMYLFTDILQIYYIISKVFTGVLVLIWNYGARKLFLYRE